MNVECMIHWHAAIVVDHPNSCVTNKLCSHLQRHSSGSSRDPVRPHVVTPSTLGAMAPSFSVCISAPFVTADVNLYHIAASRIVSTAPAAPRSQIIITHVWVRWCIVT